MSPVLIACAHGTHDDAGRACVAALVDAVRARRPALDVRDAFVDVQQPEVDAVVRAVTEAGGRAVVVPLLLSTGYHVRTDIGRAVSGRPAVAAAALGPDPRLVAVLADRLAAAGVGPADAVVLAAAGSSDPSATTDVARTVSLLQDTRPGPVTAGFGAAVTPTVPDAVAEGRRRSGRVAVASYLLAPGHFHGRLLTAGADVVTDPLLPAAEAPDPRLVDLVLDRFDAAVATLRESDPPAPAR